MYALHESLAFLLNRAGTAVANAFTAELKECGLTLPAWRVLAALWGEGGQTLSGLADVTGVEISTLSRQVAALAERQLLSRAQSTLNWRVINIELTPQGRSVVQQLLPAVERHESAALRGLTTSDVRRLKVLLGRIHTNIVSLDEIITTNIAGAEKMKSSD